MIENNLAFGIVLGFGFGSILTAGVFYAFYVQVSQEVFQEISEFKKTLGWVGIRVGSVVDHDK